MPGVWPQINVVVKSPESVVKAAQQILCPNCEKAPSARLGQDNWHLIVDFQRCGFSKFAVPGSSGEPTQRQK